VYLPSPHCISLDDMAAVQMTLEQSHAQMIEHSVEAASRQDVLARHAILAGNAFLATVRKETARLLRREPSEMPPPL